MQIEEFKLRIFGGFVFSIFGLLLSIVIYFCAGYSTLGLTTLHAAVAGIVAGFVTGFLAWVKTGV